MSSGATVGTTYTLPETQDLYDRRFSMMKDVVMPMASQLFIKEVKENATGNSELFSEFDGQVGARNKPELAFAKKLQFGSGYSKTAYLKRVASEREISEEVRRNSKFSVMGFLMDLSIKDCPYRAELDLTHILTFGLDANYTDMDNEVVDLRVGDGLTLFNEAHLLKYSTITYTNVLAGAPQWSESNFELMLELNNTEDMTNFGQAVTLDYSIIFHAKNVALGNRIRETLESSASLVDNKNSGVINALRNGTGGRNWTVLELEKLATLASGAWDSTKKLWWGIVAPGLLGWQAYYMINEPNHSKPLEETRNDAFIMGTRMGYLKAAVSGRGIKISPVGHDPSP